MDWDNLKYFLAVARSGQLLSASVRLGISQATLGRRISALELDLDRKLFDRKTTGCDLTREGQDLMAYAERIETEILQLGADSPTGPGEISGTIRIGAPDGFGVAFLAPRLHLLAHEYPNLTIQLVPVSQSFSLSQREADLAVMVGRPVKGRLRARKLTDYSLGLYAAPSYLKDRPIPQQPQDLARFDLIGYVEDLVYSTELNFTTEFWSGWQSNIEISSALGQYEAVRSGAGIGVLHDFMVQGAPDLISVLPHKKIQLTYWTVWHESMNETKRIKVVARFLDDLVRTERGFFLPPPRIPSDLGIG